MNRTSSKFLKAIPPILILLTAMACPAFSEDIQALIKNAEGGNPKAQFNLGVAYGKGEGVPQDYVLAYFRASLAKASNALTLPQHLPQQQSMSLQCKNPGGRIPRSQAM